MVDRGLNSGGERGGRRPVVAYDRHDCAFCFLLLFF
jgi:hypothetical protein